MLIFQMVLALVLVETFLLNGALQACGSGNSIGRVFRRLALLDLRQEVRPLLLLVANQYDHVIS